MEHLAKIIKVLIEKIEELRTHHILLIFSFIFVILSFSYSRFFFGAFSTFVLAVGVTFIQLARRQKTHAIVAVLLSILLLLLPFLWIIANTIWLFSEFLPRPVYLPSMALSVGLTPDWLSALGTIAAVIIALGFGVWNFIELNKQKRIGLAINEVSADGVGVIENNSQVDYSIQLFKYVLADGTQHGIAADIQRELLSSINKDEKKTKVLERIKSINSEEILPEQTISPKESISFHIHNFVAENISAIFVLLKFKVDNKHKFYLYRFAWRPNLGQISPPINDTFYPCDRWLKVYSFEG